MSKEGITVIKKENKVAFRKFILMTLVGAFIGFLVGLLTVKVGSNTFDAIASNLDSLLKTISPYIMFVMTTVVTVTIGVLYRNCKCRYEKWDGESEEEIQRIESSLSLGLYITAILLIVAFYFFAVGAASLHGVELHMKLERIRAICILGSFIVTMIVVTVSQRKIVDFIKVMNPEKRGSIYDPKFSKKWEESCDEAERLATYKCAYKAYMTATTTCVFLWVFCVIGAGIWNFGIVPVTMVSIVWIVLISSYMLAERDLSRSTRAE